MIATVLYDGITGSTNLLSALSKHPDINCLLQNPFGSDRNVTPAYCDGIYKTIKFKSDKCNIFKFRYTGYPSINKSIDHMCYSLDNFIILLRSDHVSHALSHEIKIRTNQANIRSGEKLVDIDPFEIDIRYIKTLMRDKFGCQQRVLQLTNNKKRLILDFDSLFVRETMDRIQEFLGVNTMELIGDYTRVNSMERYKRLILNYDQIAEECHDLFER